MWVFGLGLPEEVGHAGISFLIYCKLGGGGQHFVLAVGILDFSVGIAGVVHLEGARPLARHHLVEALHFEGLLAVCSRLKDLAAPTSEDGLQFFRVCVVLFDVEHPIDVGAPL